MLKYNAKKYIDGTNWNLESMGECILQLPSCCLFGSYYTHNSLQRVNSKNISWAYLQRVIKLYMVILPNLGCLLGIIIAISDRKGDGELVCLKSMGQPLNAPWQSATFYQLEVSILHGSDQGPVIDFLLHDLPWLIKALAKSSTTWVTLSHLRLEFALGLKCMSYVEKQNTHTHASLAMVCDSSSTYKEEN